MIQVSTRVICFCCKALGPEWIAYSVSIKGARARAREQGWSCPMRNTEFQKDRCPGCEFKPINEGKLQ